MVSDLLLAVGACQECSLYRNLDPKAGKKHLPVLGVGPIPASIMVIGEAPGVDEADTGVPLVGASGKRFDMLVKQAGLQRSDLFLTNLLKHRPPKNRDPHVKEVVACSHYLEQQIQAVQPSVIITLGRHAAYYFDKTVQLVKDHGLSKTLAEPWGVVKHIAMYHPAAALYDANLWAVQVADWSKLKETISGDILASIDIPTNYQLATDREATALASASRSIGFDLETTSPKRGRYFAVQEAEIVGYSVSWADGQAVYVGGKPQAIAGVLESPLYEKLCHNAKFEYGVLKRHGITLTNFQDTKLAAWMLQYHSSHLKALARQMLGRDPITYEQVTEGADMEDLDPLDVMPYGAADSDNTRLIWPTLRRQLKEAGMWELYQDVELPVIPVLHDMEHQGVLVDEAAAQSVLQDIDLEIEKAHTQVFAEGLPQEVSVGSTDQLAHALEKLGAPIRDRTEAKGLLRTDEEHLLEAKAAGWMPSLVDSILYFKGMRKLRGYAQSYLDLRGPDGRLHPDFVQSGYGEETSDDSSQAPVTGRFSCRGPNLQNQPKNDPRYETWVHRLRGCLIPTEGWSLVSADVEQEEPRIMAFINKDRAMLADFAAGIPIYAPMGAIIYGRPIGKQTDPAQWFHTKTFFLALCYGADYKKLHEIDPSIPLEQAKDGYTRLMARYPGLIQHYRNTVVQLKATGQVRDYFQRRRKIPKVYAMNRWDAEAGYREGANFLIQAPAASVMKLAMRKVWDQLHAERLDARILITVHDELVLECPDHELDKVSSILYHMTEELMPIALPVELKTGKSWGDMKVMKCDALVR